MSAQAHTAKSAAVTSPEDGSAVVRSPLYDLLVSAGAEIGPSNGVLTGLRFKDVRTEFQALTEHCAIFDLGWRAQVMVAGRDRQRWLNGMLTNNIRDLPLGQGNYSFVLNPKGHILGDLYVYNRGELMIIDSERWQLEKLIPTLRRFIIMDQVELKDLSDEWSALGIQGRGASEGMRIADLQLPALQGMQIVDLIWHNKKISVARMANEEFPTYEIWGKANDLEKLWKALVAAGAQPVGTDALEGFRVMMGLPKYGVDIRERDLPQETEQKQALDFTKGCYIGQEIVERIRSRGNVHRKFTGFLLKGTSATPGTKLELEGSPVAEITSVAKVPLKSEGERMLALGYIRRDASQARQSFPYPGGEARVASLPFAYE